MKIYNEHVETRNWFVDINKFQGVSDKRYNGKQVEQKLVHNY